MDRNQSPYPNQYPNVPQGRWITMGHLFRIRTNNKIFGAGICTITVPDVHTTMAMDLSKTLFLSSLTLKVQVVVIFWGFVTPRPKLYLLST